MSFQEILHDAIMRKDREMVKRLMSERKPNVSSNDKKITSSIRDIFITLGFSEQQVSEHFDESESSSDGLRSILDSESQYPIVKEKKNNAKEKTTVEKVTTQMMQCLDAESSWILLQCCSKFVDTSQVKFYGLICQLKSLTVAKVLSPSASEWIKNLLLQGFAYEVECIFVELHKCDISSNEGIYDGAGSGESSDYLLQSFVCPITREILIEPVTLLVIFV